ncbi:toxin-antitoxin system YwqK family antitoxin [Mucilaginibacter psychrotolerans]|uniref:MORN repeat protein n=1 Tax=Mucilaginibacter psychrotolerans TaxID=1524096 RepID=A0A4Y8S5I2_9SPHI|nr:hypothetical protein [Mucilaginibacter psychrotolerans]TFF33737.1 hypothetical protein E2R66_24390 [Mucilaginibacter psychrotolerans]
MRNYYLKLFSSLIALGLVILGLVYYTLKQPVELSTDLLFIDGLWYKQDKTLFTGSFVSHTFEGKLYSTGSIKNGMMDGLLTTYYDNGSKESECNFVNDTIVGDCIEYDGHGKIKASKTNKN